MTNIRIVKTCLDQVASFLSDWPNIYIICDRNVESVVSQLNINAKGIYLFDATEQNKNLNSVLEINRWLMECGADRDAFVLGIGGGITSDISGFAASIYKRGVKFAFVPTTLLAQVDAAIGGKNGVNLDSFKNMIGVIRQPEMTFICPEVLTTLPKSQIVSGAAELLKTFIIDNSEGYYEKSIATLKALFSSENKAEAFEALNEVIAKAASIKAGVASRDPNEHGERRLLNLGHTFAHAIEKLSEEKIGHGEAVSIGTILAAKFAEACELCSKGLAAQLEANFKECGLETSCPYSIEEMAPAMKKDKKAEGDHIHFVLPLALGDVQVRDFTIEEVINRLK